MFKPPRETSTSAHFAVSALANRSAAFLQISPHRFSELMNTYCMCGGQVTLATLAPTDLYHTPSLHCSTSLISPETGTEPVDGEDKQSLRWHSGDGQRPKGQSDFQPGQIKQASVPPPFPLSLPPSFPHCAHPVCLLNGNVARSLLRQ